MSLENEEKDPLPSQTIFTMLRSHYFYDEEKKPMLSYSILSELNKPPPLANIKMN